MDSILDSRIEHIVDRIPGASAALAYSIAGDSQTPPKSSNAHVQPCCNAGTAALFVSPA